MSVEVKEKEDTIATSIAQVDCCNVKERCNELIEVARQWEEQIIDLRSFSQIEKEALEGEISVLEAAGIQHDHEKQCLENSLMTLEDERVRTFMTNELNTQYRVETEVKLQLMESALEAVTLKCPENSTPTVADCSTSTTDLCEEMSEEKEDVLTQSVIENSKLQAEIRKLKQQLIISQISASQFKSECSLYKPKITQGIVYGKRKSCALFTERNSSDAAHKQRSVSHVGCVEKRKPLHPISLNAIEKKSNEKIICSVNIIDGFDIFRSIK